MAAITAQKHDLQGFIKEAIIGRYRRFSPDTKESLVEGLLCVCFSHMTLKELQAWSERLKGQKSTKEPSKDASS